MSDVEAQRLLQTLGAQVAGIDRHDRVRLRQWLKKLGEPTPLASWKKTRNAYLKLLARQLGDGEIAPPFDKLPDDGPLKNLNSVTTSTRGMSRVRSATSVNTTATSRSRGNISTGAGRMLQPGAAPASAVPHALARQHSTVSVMSGRSRMTRGARSRPADMQSVFSTMNPDSPEPNAAAPPAASRPPTRPGKSAFAVNTSTGDASFSPIYEESSDQVKIEQAARRRVEADLARAREKVATLAAELERQERADATRLQAVREAAIQTESALREKLHQAMENGTRQGALLEQFQERMKQQARDTELRITRMRSEYAKQREQLLARIEQQDASVDDLTAARAASEASRRHLEKQLETDREASANKAYSLLQRVGELEERVTSAEAQRTDALRQLEQSEAACRAAVEESQDLKRELKALKASMASASEEASLEQARLRRQLVDTQEQVEQAHRDLSTARQSEQSARDAERKAVRQADAAEFRAERVEAELASVRNELAGLQQTVEQQAPGRTGVLRLRSERDEAVQRVESSEKLLARTQHDLDEAKAKLAELQQSKEAQDKELDELRSQCRRESRTLAQLASSRERCRLLESQCVEAERRIKQLEQSLLERVRAGAAATVAPSEPSGYVTRSDLRRQRERVASLEQVSDMHASLRHASRTDTVSLLRHELAQARDTIALLNRRVSASGSAGAAATAAETLVSRKRRARHHTAMPGAGGAASIYSAPPPPSGDVFLSEVRRYKAQLEAEKRELGVAS